MSTKQRLETIHMTKLGGGRGKSITLILCVFPIGQFIQGEHGVVLATLGNL